MHGSYASSSVTFSHPFSVDAVRLDLAGKMSGSKFYIKIQNSTGGQLELSPLFTIEDTERKWVTYELQTVLPPGSYRTQLVYNSGSINWIGTMSDVYPNATTYGATNNVLTRDYNMQVREYAPSGPAIKRWDGSAWVDGSVKRFDGNNWVTPTTFTRS